MTPEGKVKHDVYRTLAMLEASGYVVWFERLQSGQIHHGETHIYQCRKGTFDFLTIFKNSKGTLSAAFIEVKRDDVKAVLSDTQRLFKERYEGKHDCVFFWIAQSGRDVKRLIIANCYDRVKEIDF